MFSLFKILFLLASFLPLIFADCTSGETKDKEWCCTFVEKNGFIDLSNITKIGDNAFYMCTALTSVRFGKIDLYKS